MTYIPTNDQTCRFYWKLERYNLQHTLIQYSYIGTTDSLRQCCTLQLVHCLIVLVNLLTYSFALERCCKFQIRYVSYALILTPLKTIEKPPSMLGNTSYLMNVLFNYHHTIPVYNYVIMFCIIIKYKLLRSQSCFSNANIRNFFLSILFVSEQTIIPAVQKSV